MNFNIRLGGGGGFGQQQFIQEPIFNQISMGFGINNNEYQTIVQSCKQAYMSRQLPYSQWAGKYIKSYLGGEWFVIVSNTLQKSYDFHITSVEGGDFLCFSLDNTLFQVVKVKGGW